MGNRGGWLVSVGLVVFGVLLIYSQTSAFTWDEGFHLLAAQSILAGKTPYLDFCFPQTPLNAFWNAAWMSIFGASWRVAHALSAIESTAAVMLVADYIRRRLGLPQAIAAAIILGWNVLVVEYATVGQAYALCLLLLVAAFRCTVASQRLTFFAGLFGGAAAGASLLTVLAAPVMFAWLVWRDGWRRGASFLPGAAIPWLPILWLLLKSPRAVFFNLFQYQLLYRRTNWEDATSHDIQVLSSWLWSPGALLTAILAGYGLWFVAKHAKNRAEFFLCACLALAIGVELAATHPTFESYFVLVTPFFAMLAAAGVRREWMVPAIALVMAIGLTKALHADRNGLTWADLHSVAQKVEEVVPRNGTLWADEHIYVLTHRRPAEGTEFSYAEVIDLPEPLAASLHIKSDQDLDDMAAQGKFDAVSTCEDGEVIERLKLPQLFHRQEKVGPCHVFWQPASSVTRGGVGEGENR